MYGQGSRIYSKNLKPVYSLHVNSVHEPAQPIERLFDSDVEFVPVHIETFMFSKRRLLNIGCAESPRANGTLRGWVACNLYSGAGGKSGRKAPRKPRTPVGVARARACERAHDRPLRRRRAADAASNRDVRLRVKVGALEPRAAQRREHEVGLRGAALEDAVAAVEPGVRRERQRVQPERCALPRAGAPRAPSVRKEDRAKRRGRRADDQAREGTCVRL